MNFNSLKISTDSTGPIDDIIKCYICLGKIQDACMCPNCQKLTCQKCLQKWIIEKKNQCPHCRNSLRLSQVVKYIDHISVKVKKETLETCPIHSIQFLYYCTDCKAPLCSDCFMLEETHKNHSIKKLKMIYENHRSNIKKEEEQLSQQSIGLNKYLKDINEKIIEIGNYKYKKSQELSETFDSMKNNLENNIHEILSKLMNKKNKISEKLGYLEIGKKEIEKKIAESSQSDLIKKSIDIINSTKTLITKSSCDEYIKEDIQLNLSTEIQNDLQPSYESSTFIIEHFTKLAKSKETKAIYSPGIRMNGLIWRLKVYPCGNDSSNNEHLSVFIELIESLNGMNQEPSKYFYKIELLNSDNSKKNFFQEHSSEFSQGDCWGYSRFFKLEKINREGFIDRQSNSITIKFYVRPETFSQLSRDLKYYIKQLEKKDSASIADNDHDQLKSKQKSSQINNKEDNFNLLSEESIHANDPLSKSLNIDIHSNIKMAKEIFYNINTGSNEQKEEDIKDSPIRKKEAKPKDKEKDKGIGHHYVHTIDSEPVFNFNKLSKVDISPIQEKKREKKIKEGKSSEQLANLKKFQIDLSSDSPNEDDFKDYNFIIPKNVKSDSFDEDSYAFLMESLRVKDEKEPTKNLNKKDLNLNKKQDDKNIFNGLGNNPFLLNNNPYSINNHGNYSNGRHNPFANFPNKNSQYSNNDLFKNIFEQKK